jgi:superfamily II DNA or RNA helicase
MDSQIGAEAPGTQPAPDQSPTGPGAAARALATQARTFRTGISDALTAPEVRRKAARRAFDVVRDDIGRQQLAEIPLARLKETTQGRLRLAAIGKAGYRTVGQAAAAGQLRLQQIPGVGPQTAAQVIAAARQLEAAMIHSVRVRLDPDARTAAQAQLLGALSAYGAAELAVSPLRDDLSETAASLDAILADASRASSHLRLFFARRRKREAARDALAQLGTLMGAPAMSGSRDRLASALSVIGQPVPGANEIWKDYESRAAAYNGLLIEIGELSPDIDAGQGFVPGDLAQRVREHPLDLSLLDISLRGYQAFGAKFALTQRKAILGDEMGLGKTIEALAAMCHLRVEGHRHFLVIAPASVLVNWAHEIERHSQLRAYRLHGPDKARNLHAWARSGGVAVTTYDALRSLAVPAGVDIALLVVDEAHYAKNPAAARTKAVVHWVSRTGRVLFLTGTPMENRVEEFRTLVGHLRPELAARIGAIDGLLGPVGFRKAVAAVYLRRNQSDVLAELPPRIETEDWVTLSGPALAAYREAVAAGNFMAMRRAAYATDSAKLTRLTEIAGEAAANGRKVVVFSYFLDVIRATVAALGDLALGPLTGSLPPAARQALVDEFTASPGPAVLVSQIQAGGVGLNIQAASVVILTEPQWKPTTEEQAIARCHRMGQVRPVDVHRLLAEDSVDQRMLEVLAVKASLFDEYVRRSELKEHSPDAVDISDLGAVQEAATQAEAERRIVEMERKRLGLNTERPKEPEAADL